MREKLIIRLGHTLNDKLQWLIWSDQEQEIIASGELNNSDELESLDEKGQSREIIVLLPAAKVQLKKVALPGKWNRKLEQALPFIVEEEVAADLDDLIFSIGQPFQAEDLSHGIEIALFEKAWFDSWHTELNKHNLMATRIVPDALLLPQLEEHKAAAIELDGNWLIRSGNWQIAEVEPEWLETYLQISGIETIRHYSPCDFTGIALESDEADFDLPLAIFAKGLKQNSFTLLQGQYEVKKQSNLLKPVWRGPAIAASVAIVMSLSVKGYQLYELNQQLDIAKQEVKQQYSKAFPKAKVRPNLIRKQLKNKLKTISAGSETGFLELMDDLVVVFQQEKEFSPQSLRYDNKRKEIRLRARGKDFQSFSRVKSTLEKQDLLVEQGALNNDGDQVVGEVKLRRKS